MRVFVTVLLILPILVHSCTDNEYQSGDQCCKKCGPGTRMTENSPCGDPFCQDCGDGEYQDGYTTESKCKRQPVCKRNLNFLEQRNPSKTQRSDCQCIPGYHCSSEECITCVMNSKCQLGHRIKKESDGKTDTECELCPPETYSSNISAQVCTSWTECPDGHTETVPGSSTSDRICEPSSNERLGIGIFVGLLAIAVIAGFLYWCCKKDHMRSMNLDEKLQKHCPVLCSDIKNNHPPAKDNAYVENENAQPLVAQVSQNEPEEDMEDTTRQDDHFKNGLSANGMPIDQDHSKTSILSQSETHPSSGSYTFSECVKSV